MKQIDVAIIGGGPAGRVIVHTLHHSGQKFTVSLFKDEEINVNRCAIPYGIDGNNPLDKYQIPNTLVTDFGAELVITKVTEINPATDTIKLADGREFHYRYLVLATGSRPLKPPIEGIKSPEVIPVRSLDDLDQLRQKVTAAKLKKTVVIGGGYIGVEVAVVLREMGFEVTIVEMLPQILMQTCEPEFSEFLCKILRDREIGLRTNVRVTAFRKTETLGIEVGLEDNTTIPCDFAVLATGVQLNTDIAEAAGIETNRFGIVADDFQCTNFKNIFTAGDCSGKQSLVTNQPTRGEFGTNAVFMGKIVARNIIGEKARFPGVINANATKVFDWGIGSAGLTEKMACDAGLDVITGQSEVLDKYPMINGVSPIYTKLVFEHQSGRLLGGTVMRRGEAVVGNIDLLSLAIQMNATIDDLLVHQYATHPELAAKPSDNLFVFAAEKAAKARGLRQSVSDQDYIETT